MDRLLSLTTFVRAAESSGFTEAGRQLGVSASAVGKTVARLEERLGARLFHRNTRSITLTEEGRMFLEASRRIIHELEAVEQKLAQGRNAPKGRLRASLPILPDLFTPALNIFMARYPGIELDLSFSDRLVDVVDDGFDVAVRTGEGNDSRLMSRTLGSYRLEIVGSPRYFSRYGLPDVPKDLEAHVCMHHRYPTTGRLEAWPFAPGSTPADFSLPVSMAASTLEPLISLAESGAGVTCLPDFATARQVSEGTLMRVLAGHLAHMNIFRAVWPSSRHLSPKIRVFVDCLADNLFRQHG